MPESESQMNPFTEELFLDCLIRRERGELVDFDALRREHPDLAAELRAFEVGLNVLGRLASRLNVDASLSARLWREFGERVDPEIDLRAPEETPEPERSSELFERLRSQAPNGTRYRVLGEVARGGMGVVLKVWDEDLRRTLAMKVVLGKGVVPSGGTPVVDPESLGRFLEEAQVTGQLDHPGIVPVHELGLGSDGRVYFTMRLVKGDDLRTVFDLVHAEQNGWSTTRALGVLLRVCEAMSYAHTKGVIHRDLKPSNVMVGKFGEVYVMDWGLARVLGQEDRHDLRVQPRESADETLVATERREQREATPGSPLVTRDGTIVGTASYMPPEQAQGHIEELGPASDVYSLGAMLYHLLSGEIPFVREGERVSPQAVIMRVIQGPPTPLHELAPMIPAELVAICEKAMAREPVRRYCDTQELADDLRAYLERRVVAAYETGAWAETKKWLQRNKPLAASLAAVVLALVAGVVVALSLKGQADANAWLASENEQKAKAGETDALRQKAIATQKANDVLSLSAIQDLKDLVNEADALWPADPEMVPSYERWLEKARVLIEGQPADPAHGIQGTVSLAQHEAKLSEIQARAVPQSEADATRDREGHPQFAIWKTKQAELTWSSRMLGREPWPNEDEVEATLAKELPPSDAKGLNALPWPLVDPQKPVYGQEVRALLFARRAVAAAAAPDKAEIRDTLAWALFKVGQFDEAAQEERRAAEEVGAEKRAEYEGYVAKLEKAIGRWKGEAALAERGTEQADLAIEVQQLERAVNRRQTWAFEDRDDRWWNAQLSKLVTDLEALRAPTTGLYSSGISREHGWGIRKRYEFASGIVDRTIGGAEAKRRWSEAIEGISKSEKYRGVKWPSGDRLVAQAGLLPIGADPESGLWEFAHLATGAEAQRGADGSLGLDEKMGVVLVLIPGGTFRLGAQTDPAQPNFDLKAQPKEGPVRELTLSPYFVSKYELTQAQWQRFTTRNPSHIPFGFPAGDKPVTLLNPVESVTWTECTEFTRRLGLLLPTEAQWEHATRAGTSTPWWTGADIKQLAGAANMADGTMNQGETKVAYDEKLNDGFVTHAPVGSFRPNYFGLHDVHGNVWEWCRDGYGAYDLPVSAGDCERQVLRPQARVNRGGGWSVEAFNARASNRSKFAPSYVDSSIGLRPVRHVITP